MDKKYRSSLVVWRTDEIPVIETFHADSREDIDEMQGEWMNKNGYTKGHMTLYTKDMDEWKVVEKAQFHNFLFPKFAFLKCAPHEEEKIKEFMKYKIIQLDTGRIVNVVPADKSDKSGFINKELVISGDENKEWKYIMELVKFSEEDIENMENPECENYISILDKVLFLPLGEWIVKTLEFGFNNE